MQSLAKDQIRIVLLEGIHANAENLLRSQGYTNITSLKESPDERHLAELLHDVHILGIRSKTQLTAKILAKAHRLFAVGCYCIGTNQVDTAYCQERGISVFNAPFANTRSVAELVIAEAILLLRRIPERNHQAHQGIWDKSAAGQFEARGKTLGIIGYGHIGSQVSVLAESLGMKVIYYDIASKLPLGNAQPQADLPALLKAADIVTLHVPETPQTQHLINAQTLAYLKASAVLVNASRGTVVDITALTHHLKQGRLLGAAIDVFPHEPAGKHEAFHSPLQGLPNVILTPHIAGSTVEAQAAIGMEVSEKLIRYSDNGSTESAVNFPEVNLPQHAGQTRILHFHRNQPGMLGHINDIFSEANINVSSQYLQTLGQVGYCVMDIAFQGDHRALKAKLTQIPGTIRVRVLL